MSQRSFSVRATLAALVFVLAGLGSFLSSASPARPATLYYLGLLADGYPAGLLERELGRSHAEILGIDEGLILFGITPRTSPTGLLKKLPFLREVYAAPKDVRLNASLRGKKLGRQFLDLPGRDTVFNPAPSSVPPSIATSLATSPSALSPDMRALDQKLAALARATSGLQARPAVLTPRAMVTDDLCEPNDSLDTAYALSPGSWGGFQCLDDDWFKVNLSAGQDILVNTYFTEADGRLGLDVRNYDGTSYFSAATGRNFNRAYLANMPAGYVYIHIYGLNSATNAYSMTITTGNVLGDIAGKVTNESAVGIPNLWVYTYDSDYFSTGYVSTNATGNYGLSLPPDVYRVYFNGPDAGNYVVEWYNDKSTFASADGVSVVAGGTATVNAQLATGGYITGRVTDQGTGSGIYNFWVYVYDLEGNYAGSTQTAADGTYSIRGIAAGQYKASFDTYSFPDYLPEWYNDKPDFESADSVSVSKGATTPNISASLAPAAKISGLVTDAVTTAALDGVSVNVYDLNGQLVRAASTNGGGAYLCGGLRQGFYKVRFVYDALYYVPQWYNGVLDYDSAQAVSAVAGSTTGGISAQLEQGGAIKGTVNDDDGNPLNILVKVFSLSGVEVGYGEGYGSYTVTGVPAGPCRVYFDASYASGHGSEWYMAKSSFAAADQVQVAAGQATLNINASLANLCNIRGTVKNKRDVPLARVLIAAYDLNHQYVGSVQTDPSGSYVLSLREGSYKVYFDPAYTLGSYLPEWYENKSTFDTANVVAAYLGEVKVNASLDSPTSITVVSPAGGSTLYTGTNQNITWGKNGAQASTVKIQLYKGSTLVKTITTSTANDGSFTWAIAATTANATNYRIKVTTTDNKVSGWSGTFAVAKPSITITAPTAASNWVHGSFHTITWSKSGPMSDYLNVQLFLGTAKKLDIALNAANAGGVGWTIPLSLAASTSYWVKITTVDGKVTTKSAKFRIS